MGAKRTFYKPQLSSKGPKVVPPKRSPGAGETLCDPVQCRQACACGRRPSKRCQRQSFKNVIASHGQCSTAAQFRSLYARPRRSPRNFSFQRQLPDRHGPMAWFQFTSPRAPFQRPGAPLGRWSGKHDLHNMKESIGKMLSAKDDTFNTRRNRKTRSVNRLSLDFHSLAIITGTSRLLHPSGFLSSHKCIRHFNRNFSPTSSSLTLHSFSAATGSVAQLFVSTI
jgi:hypothetical protein